jgi:hypothetical protein
MASAGRMISKSEFESVRREAAFTEMTQNPRLLKYKMRKFPENFSEGRQCTGRDSKRGPPEYKSGASHFSSFVDITRIRQLTYALRQMEVLTPTCYVKLGLFS